jgi:phospholipid/cholesterol/gamma-HCH transport system ATP-binding protein
MIEVKDVYKSFRDNHVLRGVSLVVDRGETVVIIGRSGCVKSVLLKAIIGLLPVDSGSILVDGEDISNGSIRDIYRIRRKFGMLFQASALFDSMTVDENVGLALREHTTMPEEEIRKVVAEKLELVGLSGIRNLKPAELSGGMRKRVGLARALAMDPDYILYDEPTTGLDPIMGDRINELVLDLKRKLRLTSIAVTHDIKSAYKIADRIALLYGGKIVFSGTPSEVESTDDPLVQQFVQGRAEGPMIEV